jgi:uncharacterized protein (DUF1684 family)
LDAFPDYAAEIEAWRRRRVERLVSENGWLSLTGLFWLEPGDNPVGSDASSAVVLPESAPRRAGTIRLERGQAVFLPTDGAGPRPLASDAADAPTVLAFGPARLHVVERGGRLAARVRDVDHPARRSLRPIPAFPVDPAWRLDARVEPYEPPRRIPIPSILGSIELETAPGAVVFTADGREHRLDPILERGEDDWWIIFGDRTNGRDTYAGGRFVYVAPPVGGRTILDFNKAYNPPCVFTPHSTCPLPPPQNRLAIRVEAGEKTYA